jgi:hypothetical protein
LCAHEHEKFYLSKGDLKKIQFKSVLGFHKLFLYVWVLITFRGTYFSWKWLRLDINKYQNTQFVELWPDLDCGNQLIKYLKDFFTQVAMSIASK